MSDKKLLNIFQNRLDNSPPVWIMRQAGRYLPEYRATRAKAGNFLNLCQSPELACEVALQPLRRYELDAAILFSDILTIPDAMGLGLYFAEGEGPCFQHPLQREESILNVSLTDPADKLSYVFEAVKLIRQEMPKHLPLIGFAGSPWTLACYMVEGKSNKSFPAIMNLISQNPQLVHILLSKLAQAVATYLILQIEAGADVIMLFDTWGGLLSTENYRQYSLFYVQEIVHAVKRAAAHTPIILFTKGGGRWLEEMQTIGCDALGVDWTISLSEARAITQDKICLQGNLHPEVLLTDKNTIIQEVQKVLASYGQGHGHIFNLGHGITPEVPPHHVDILVEAVQQWSPHYHQG